ncbi:MAG: TonB-dependent receptor, partial [Sphingomonadales bacterium]
LPVDLEGNDVPRSPRFVSNIAAQYDVALENAGLLTPRAEFQFQSRQFLSQFNEPSDRQGAFAIVNARLTYTSPDEHWKLAGYVRNIFDKAYLSTATPNAFLGDAIGIYAPPRTYGMQLTASF